ncbi:MAG: hypothetical protein HC880_05535 [Bacteroidia bacterium]|nr:hypothetical protein [Bacteroidia bacterium]
MFISNPSGLSAQEPVPDDTLRPKVSFWKKYLQKPTGVRLGVDVAPLIRNFLDESIRQYALSGELLLGDQLFIAADAGIQEIRRGERVSYDYVSNGMYVRLGVDYNLWQGNTALRGGLFTVGLRYGLAFFRHALTYSLDTTYWEPGVSGQLEEPNLAAHWLELGGSLRARLLQNLYIGPYARFAFRLAHTQTERITVNDIPGYGYNNGLQLHWGYYIMYRIQWGHNRRQVPTKATD